MDEGRINIPRSRNEGVCNFLRPPTQHRPPKITPALVPFIYSNTKKPAIQTEAELLRLYRGLCRARLQKLLNATSKSRRSACLKARAVFSASTAAWLTSALKAGVTTGAGFGFGLLTEVLGRGVESLHTILLQMMSPIGS